MDFTIPSRYFWHLSKKLLDKNSFVYILDFEVQLSNKGVFMTEPKKIRKEKEQEFHKKLILDAAKRLFAKKSIIEVTVDEIAKESGFAKSTLYSYFASKEALVSELLDSIITERLKELEDIAISDASPEKKILMYIGINFEEAIEDRDMAVLLSRESHLFYDRTSRTLSKDIMNKILSAFKRSHSLLARIYDEGREKGVFREMEPHLFSTFLLSVIRGIIVRWWHFAPDEDIKFYINPVYEIILHGIEK
ncbi:MAG: hypothetical protein B6D65_04785 [candidate division Zixibacteria bacterium 4484_93]|nr:MAG: hypothetical protein B6D65_04785 [candidate division Zixibacteria bacterium 4484_93]